MSTYDAILDEERMAETERLTEIGIGVGSREVSIGLVATWWDRAPDVSTATALLTTDMSTLKTLREHTLNMPVEEMLSSLRYLFETNLITKDPDNAALLI